MVSDLLANGKDLVALLRDAALLGLAVLLLLWPTTFNDMMVNAGFEEGSIVGFKWKAKLVESDQQLQDAQTTITELKAQNEKLTKALSDATEHSNDPDLKSRVADLDAEGQRLKQASTMIQNAVKATIASNAPFIQKAQASIGGTTTWGVVFGGDTTLDAARYETGTIASQLGIADAAIYCRNGSFRSVATSANRPDAEANLIKAKVRRADAYIVNMATWCPQAIERTGYKECASP